jgi:antitoxin component YwqK of YwqJK toxin-antitoxin module
MDNLEYDHSRDTEYQKENEERGILMGSSRNTNSIGMEREGEYKSWHENGQPYNKQFYLDGKIEGERKVWYINGQPMIREFYQNGKSEGKLTCWGGNGQIMSRLFYRNGEREGKANYWHGTGDIQDCCYLINSRIIKYNFCQDGVFANIKKSSHLKQAIITLEELLIPDLAGIVKTI